MATDKRLIDANVILKEKTVLWDTALGFCDCVLVEDIDKAPTVDAVEVVRCKDCRFSAQYDIYDPIECMKWKTKWGVAYTSPDGFCNYGERKKENM